MVVIVGGGPAGASAAIALRKLDIPCVVIDENDNGAVKPGENLPANILPTLKELGILETLSHNAHIQSIGNKIYWGSNKSQSREYISEPYGFGWHLNRSFFEKQLKNLALSQNVVWLNNWRCIGVKDIGSSFLLQCKDDKGNAKVISAYYLIDATGRSSRITRMLGIQRISLDRLTAYYSQIEQEVPELKGKIFIEAVEDGWWYAASISEKKIVLNFMSDVDLQNPKSRIIQDWLFHKYLKSVHLRKLVNITDKTKLLHVTIKPVATSVLEKIVGNNWLAVGDAACAYDPLSAYGLSSALGGGLYASLSIMDYLSGEKEAVDAYKLIQQKTFNTCITMLQNQYNLETRWPESLFWKRRIQTS